jgi:hypothetical protein
MCVKRSKLNRCVQFRGGRADASFRYESGRQASNGGLVVSRKAALSVRSRGLGRRIRPVNWTHTGLRVRVVAPRALSCGLGGTEHISAA